MPKTMQGRYRCLPLWRAAPAPRDARSARDCCEACCAYEAANAAPHRALYAPGPRTPPPAHLNSKPMSIINLKTTSSNLDCTSSQDSAEPTYRNGDG